MFSRHGYENAQRRAYLNKLARSERQAKKIENYLTKRKLQAEQATGTERRTVLFGGVERDA